MATFGSVCMCLKLELHVPHVGHSTLTNLESRGKVRFSSFPWHVRSWLSFGGWDPLEMSVYVPGKQGALKPSLLVGREPYGR